MQNKSQNLEKLNLSKFSKDVENFVTVSNSKNQRSTIYVYPENWTALNINSGEGKRFRSKRRDELTRFQSEVKIAVTSNDSEKMKSTVTEFNKWYKLYFKLNDFSINSLTQSQDVKKESILKFLEIIKNVNSQLTTPKKEKKAKTETTETEISQS